MKEIQGVHHVTAIAGDPQTNLDFYSVVLGLRLVKRTVNFDDPGTYHLYYGDDVGNPGTLLTFFPWKHAAPGRPGVGQVTVTAFAAPRNAIGYWSDRLKAYHASVQGISERFGEPVLSFLDPDGLRLELIGVDALACEEPWLDGPVPEERAIGGIHSVTLKERSAEATTEFMTGVLGLRHVLEDGARARLETAGYGRVTTVDVLHGPADQPGRISRGSVHHVAWRVSDEEQQVKWREHLGVAGVHVTPVFDRQYFRSIYFREPGGVLFEIATDPPGFMRDERREALGSDLKLPPWLEEHRGRIQEILPTLEPRTGVAQ